MKLFNVSRSKYRLEEIKNKNKYAIERKREIRSHLGNARLVSLSKKKEKEHIAFETFIDTDKFFRSKLFFPLND